MEAEDFIINIVRLKIGSHEFKYDINEEFLNFFYPNLVEKAQVSVKLNLRKSETMIEISFVLDGEVDIICDRSLETFTEPIQSEKTLYFKFGEEAQELAEDVIIIPFHQHEIEVAQFVYEFVALSIPMKKLHPKFREEFEAEDDGNEELLIYSSSESDQEDESSEPIDPRWEALKHINKN